MALTMATGGEYRRCEGRATSPDPNAEKEKTTDNAEKDCFEDLMARAADIALGKRLALPNRGNAALPRSVHEG